MSQTMKMCPSIKRMACVLGMTLVLAACDDKSKTADAQSAAGTTQPGSTATPSQADLAGSSSGTTAKPAASAAGAAGQKPVAPASHASVPLTTLGAISVDRAEIDTLLDSLPPEQAAQLKGDRAAVERVIRARLSEKALVAQARDQGWTEKEDVKRTIALATEQTVFRSYLDSVSLPPETYPSQAELEAAYESSKSQFIQPASFRISQIFLAAPEGDANAVAQARKQAADILKRARARQADFAAIARSSSQDSGTAKNGGDMGLFVLPQIVPELRGVVQGMKAGEISEPIQLRGGIHIVKLTERNEQSVAPLDAVKDRLRTALRSQHQEQAARAYLDNLLNAGTVSIDGKAISTLVQPKP